MFAAVVCFAAYWFRINRFYMHAGLIFLGAVLHQWLDVQWEFGFIGAGSIIVLVGLGFLIGFIRKYPRPIQEAPGGYR
jgi:hypothetical protein